MNTLQITDDELEKRIDDFMQKLGFDNSLEGYVYLREAIALAIRNPELIEAN